MRRGALGTAAARVEEPSKERENAERTARGDARDNSATEAITARGRCRGGRWRVRDHILDHCDNDRGGDDADATA